MSSPTTAAWSALFAEAEAFEAWYLPTQMHVNAWVGIGVRDGFYGGWSVEGDPLMDEWDEEDMTTAAGDSPEAVIADLIRIARAYRERTDERNAEIRADAEPNIEDTRLSLGEGGRTEHPENARTIHSSTGDDLDTGHTDFATVQPARPFLDSGEVDMEGGSTLSRTGGVE